MNNKVVSLDNIRHNETVTIGETIDRYKFLKEAVAGKSFDLLSDLAIDTPGTEGFVPNDTYFHALYLTEKILNKTNSNLRILCGRDITRFLEVLEDSFLEACERITANKGVVKICAIVHSKTEAEDTKDKLSEFLNGIRRHLGEGRIEAKIKNYEENLNFKHYIVADSKLLREEEGHPPLSENMPASNIKAKVYFDNFIAAQRYEIAFDKSF